MSETPTGNGHDPKPPPELIRQVLAAVGREYGLLATPALREIGADDGDPQWGVGIVDFLAEIDAPIVHIVDEFIYSESLTVLIGPPKGGKTFLLSAWAVRAAAQGRKVYFVEAEGPRRLLRDRLRPFAQPDPTAYAGQITIAHKPPLMLNDRKSVDSLLRQIQGYHLLILDPLVMLHTLDENEQADMSQVMQAISRIIDATGVAVLLAHHTKKGDTWDKRARGDEGSGASRGSGAIIGAADSILFLKGVPEEERVHGEVRFWLANPDTRIGEPFERRLGIIKLGGGVATLEWDDPEKARAKSEDAEHLLDKLLEYVPEAPAMISVDDLAGILKARKATVSAAVALGEHHKLLFRARDGRRQGVQRPASKPTQPDLLKDQRKAAAGDKGA